ncbi:hypothetical protein FMUAM8_28100 [Nocardia cyriacigeorgica]|nr:hypothetical protein FMUAM8_28100 [Nocardia cyriacigeorgica]
MAMSAFAVVIAPTPTASAASCSTGDACFWSGENYSGRATQLKNSDNKKNYCINLNVPSQSVISNYDRQFLLSSESCGGGKKQYRYVSAGQKVPSLGFTARSISWCPSC